MTAGCSADLFKAVVADGLQHPSFRRLAASPEYSGARTLMQRTYDQWASADRQFVRDLQTEGFDARVFELYLAATLANLGWTIGREGERPDFRCRGPGLEFYVEAATANAPGNPSAPATTADYIKRLQSQTDNHDEVAVRFGSVLRNKVNMRYQDLPHVSGRSIVIAVQAFFGPGSLLHNELPLMRYLYNAALVEFGSDGARTPTNAAVGYHVGDTKTIPSGFFDDAEAAFVSAVLWSNSGTVQEFNRMAYALGLGTPGWEIHRFGTELDRSPGASERALFVERVEPGRESWEEGLVVVDIEVGSRVMG